MISIDNPNIIIVTEIFPKILKCTNIDNNEYKIRGFSCFMGPVADACRGVAIFIKGGIDFELKKVLLPPPPPREFCRHILS